MKPAANPLKSSSARRANIPTIFVVFGATGDLMNRKITPALFHLFTKGQLPNMFEVIGFSRQNLSPADFREKIFEDLTRHKDLHIATCSRFCELISYQQGLFEKKSDYLDLQKTLQRIDEKWGVCSNKLFYLAVPPPFYETILKNLAASGLTKPCGPQEGWTRVLVEKPFGKDLKTAQKLDELLSRLFKETQIYRIDHYLAKEMLQNIISFRFSNNFLEDSWGNQLIERIHIKLLETIGVEDRGGFYDGVGALRDVGQNHLLQMLALVTMENPMEFTPEAIRRKRAEILKTLRISKQTETASSSFRAQYKGYLRIKGVTQNSKTETYFKVRAFLTHPRWTGVPIILESGKRLKERKKEIEIVFAHPKPCLCRGADHLQNKLFIRLEPSEGITLTFLSKKPGLQMDLEERTFEFNYREVFEKQQYTEEYEKLLFDCIAGDQTLFVSSEEVKTMWRFTDPIVKAWQKGLVPLSVYTADTDEVRAQSTVAEERGQIPRLRSGQKPFKKEIVIIGLGKMGSNLARLLHEKQWRVVGLDKEKVVARQLEKDRIIEGAYTLKELTAKLRKPRLIWLMVPSSIVDEILFGRNGLVKVLAKGDVVIDGGNSFYEDSIRRSKKLASQGIHFLDVGVSGGPAGARRGSALMIGGEKKIFEKTEPLFRDLAAPQGYGYMGKSGAGHFVKMVHNGIEYGMMQAIGEGFALLKKSPYKLNLKKIAEVYGKGSVIESRLIAWLKEAFGAYGENLARVSGSVAHTGEGEWTVNTAKKLGIPVPVLKQAFTFRVRSQTHPSYIGKILTALRHQFGGHPLK